MTQRLHADALSRVRAEIAKKVEALPRYVYSSSEHADYIEVDYGHYVNRDDVLAAIRGGGK